MQLKYYFLPTFFLIFIGCYNEDDFKASHLTEIMELNVKNDQALANSHNKITIQSVFPLDFNTEDDSTVNFSVIKDSVEKISSTIKSIENNGSNEKLAEISVFHNKAESLEVEAVITVNGTEVSKKTNITFKRAYSETINVLPSSLKIAPDSSFSEIIITTQLLRENGKVTIGTQAETTVKDANGVNRGIFVNYQNKSDGNGKIINRFTMGNDNYMGPLFIVSNSMDESGQINEGKTIIYSQK